jgi:hypothetical protein
MVNEIEDGVYVDKNEPIQQFNPPPRPKAVFQNSNILKKDNGSYQSHKFGRVVEIRKRMPQFKKVNRVPNPDSKMFHNFEKFLHQSRKEEEKTADVTAVTDESAEKAKETTVKKNGDDFCSRIIESKEYQLRKA